MIAPVSRRAWIMRSGRMPLSSARRLSDTSDLGQTRLPPPQSKSAVADFDTHSAEVGQARLRSGGGWGGRTGGTANTGGAIAADSAAPSPPLPRKRGREQPRLAETRLAE